MKQQQHIMWIIGVAFCFCLSMSSCSGTKHLKEDQQLYIGSNFKFEPAKKVKDDNTLKNLLKKNLAPKPNKKFLGLFQLRVWAYLKLKPKKEKGFKHWLHTKIGKEPVLISDIDIKQKELLLEKTMQDNGYFHTHVKASLHPKKRNEKAVMIDYTIENEGPTYIDTFIIQKNKNATLDSIVRNFQDFEVQSDQIYNLENIQSDRNNLAYRIRSHGYYDFNKNDIIYLVDTSEANQFEIKLIVKKPADSLSHQKYFIRNVTIFPSFIDGSDEYWRDTKFRVENKKENDRFFKIREHHQFITRKVISENIFIEPEDLFSIDDYKITSSRLVGLGLYKFVNIDYKKMGRDSLDVTVRLTPTQHQRFKTSVELSTSTLGFLGSSFSVMYNNKNTAHKAINLTLRASFGTEFQFNRNDGILNILDVSVGLSFSVPRRLRFIEEKLKTAAAPTTTFSISENFQQWLQFYTINDLNLEYSYNWQRKIKPNRPQISHKLSPANFSWLYLFSTTTEFDSLLDNSSQLRTSFENNFIIGSKYQLTVNTKTDSEQKNYFLLQHNLETSGNLAYLFGKMIKPKQEEQYEIVTVPFSQFTRVDLDYRNYWNINNKTSFISRINTGIGFTYGNSNTLPYSRQFFVGGPNTIRAFQIRDIGPGRYETDGNQNSVEQTGDFKLLMNMEYRWTIYKFIRMATFIDAGNVWLLRNDPERPDGVFEPKDFLTEMGLGTGLGIRLDFNFVAIRLDLGIPLYTPYEEEGQRWINNEISSTSFKAWRKDSWVWNFAIGYPF